VSPGQLDLGTDEARQCRGDHLPPETVVKYYRIPARQMFVEHAPVDFLSCAEGNTSTLDSPATLLARLYPGWWRRETVLGEFLLPPQQK